MANTYSQIYIQVVFAVKGRESHIHKTWKQELYKYMSGIITNKGHKAFIINGMPDHIHLLISLNPDTALSDLVRDVKNNSTNFINNSNYIKQKFSWQRGYGAFSYSKSQVTKVYQYIENQEAHHSKKTFKSEYLELLDNFAIEYNPEYLFDWEE